MNEISRRLSGVMTETTITLPVDKLALLPWLYDHAIVDGREDNEDGSVTLDLRLSETEAVELERRMGNGPKPQTRGLGIGASLMAQPSCRSIALAACQISSIRSSVAPSRRFPFGFERLSRCD